MKICTSIEQSKKLIELGIDVNTADMHYSTWTILNEGEYILSPNQGETIEELQEDYGNQIIPAWSLSALLGLMPKSICIKQSEHSGYFYFLEWQFANDNSLRYVGNDRKCLIDIYSDHDDNWKDSIDTAFEMVVWLKENEKI